MSLNHQLKYLESKINWNWNKSSTLIIIFKSKTSLLDPLNSSDEFSVKYVKYVKHHCVFLNSNPGASGKCSATSQTPVYKGLKKGRTMAGRGKDCHWLTWGQLPLGAEQESWHQDVWPPPDGSHYLMRGHIWFVGMAQYILARGQNEK